MTHIKNNLDQLVLLETSHDYNTRNSYLLLALVKTIDWIVCHETYAGLQFCNHLQPELRYNMNKLKRKLISCIIDKTIYSLDSIYLDFPKVFDRLSHSHFTRKQRAYRITGSLLEWFESYQSGRLLSQVFFSIDQTNLYKFECSQGSLLEPFLFSIFINDIGSVLNCRYLVFADNMKIYMNISLAHIPVNSKRLSILWSVCVRTWWSSIFHCVVRTCILFFMITSFMARSWEEQVV